MVRFFRGWILKFITNFTNLSQCEKYHKIEHDALYIAGPQSMQICFHAGIATQCLQEIAEKHMPHTSVHV